MREPHQPFSSTGSFDPVASAFMQASLGMFVRARIDEGIQSDAILIPQQGVSRTPRGDATVLIVNNKSQVEARPVVASQAIGDKWLISEGLKSGDQVIVSGLQKARPGEQVKATTDTPADTASK